MIEEWRPVRSHPDYEVSTLGRVRSWRRGAGPRGRILRGNRNRSGRGYVSITLSPTYEQRLLHHVVLEAFVGPRPPGREGAHRNGVQWDNRLSNLYWATHKENGEDNARLGVSKGVLHGGAKLTEEQVQAIRAATGSQRVIGHSFGIDQSTVSMIRSRKAWGHVA